MQALTFLHCGYTPQCMATVAKKFDYFTLQLMTRGELALCYEAEAHVLRGGWVWPTFPGPMTRFERAAGCPWWEHRYVAFQGAAVSRWQAEGLWPGGPQPLPGEQVVALFDELLANALRTDVWSARRATLLLELVLLELAQTRRGASHDRAWLDQVLQQLDEDEKFAPDYERLAHECGWGLSTLRRRFREATGVTLHQYVMQRRIARARELLAETDWPLKRIADNLNFSDVYFFSAQFRKLAGVTPTAYRKSRQ